MTKKQKKHQLSDRVRNKASGRKRDLTEAVRKNPFEIKINKQKHQVLGKKLAKYDKGVPGVSRSKAMKKRQDTLLLEYQNKLKTNKLIDNRIGEKNSLLTEQEKITRRFTAESKRQFGARKYNLDDDDDEDGQVELTHQGQSLREIEKFDRPVDYSDDDEDGKGALPGHLVSSEHFGGGILKSKGTDGTAEKTFKDKMEEMIAKSKLAKHERQAERDELTELTDRLDGQWRNLHNVVASIRRSNYDDDDEYRGGKPCDDYDIAVNSLRFEHRGNPSERLRTEEELAQQEKQCLEKLESERLARMRGEAVKSARPHRSADDLDDGMDYGEEDDEGFVALYKDGKLVNRTDDGSGSGSEEQEEDYSEEDGVSGSEEDEEEGEDEEGEEEEGEDEEGEAIDEDGDSCSDLASDAEPSDSDAESLETAETKASQNASASIEPQRADIPFTFIVPGSYTSFIELMDKYSLQDQHTVVERMRKCNHPSLSADNKQHLVRLYGYLLEYFGDIALRVPVPISLLDQLTIHLYQMAHQSPQETSQLSKQLILDRHQLFTEYCKAKNGRGVWPFLDLMMYFKLMSILYPASDFRHEVITPTMLFASQIYFSCPVANHRDVAVSLMLTTVMCEYVSFSKCLMPETVNLLSALLSSASPSEKPRVTVGTAVVKSNLLLCKAGRDELRLKEMRPFNLNQVIARGVGNSIYNTDDFRLTALYTTAVLLNQFVTKHRALCAARSYFRAAETALAALDREQYPESLKMALEQVGQSLASLNGKPLDYVCRERRKPKVLKTYEPEIEDGFDGSKKKPADKVAAERKKLKQQYKKELKSTIREVKKDRAFIASQSIKEKIKRDAERHKKTNKILADLQGQQHEINMFHKMNRKPKRRK